MKLVPGNDPILRTPAPEFDFHNPPTDPIQLAKDMAAFMLEHKGIGLSACQVGLLYRVFVMKTNPIITCFNPRIVDEDRHFVNLEEGCLSFPNLIVKIKRSNKIRVRYQLPNGTTETKVFMGITARCFQHELDHLNGILFYNRADRYHRDRALRKYERLNKFMKRTPEAAVR